MQEHREKILKECIKRNPAWGSSPDVSNGLKNIIEMADTNGDGYKRVTVGDKTYLVPIEDIICFGIKAEDVPVRYKEDR